LILYRCFAWLRRRRANDEDGPLWFPRPFQGEGRHDNPDAYGCLYLADSEVSGVVEQLARFRGQPFVPEMLVRRGLPLGLAAIELDADAELIDLDEPDVLGAEGLRPSVVATRIRDVTQPQALELYVRHPRAAAIRWWSVFESLWANITVFDRAAEALRLLDVRALTPDDAVVSETAELLGISR
jgi:RES domain-containing protein